MSIRSLAPNSRTPEHSRSSSSRRLARSRHLHGEAKTRPSLVWMRWIAALIVGPASAHVAWWLDKLSASLPTTFGFSSKYQLPRLSETAMCCSPRASPSNNLRSVGSRKGSRVARTGTRSAAPLASNGVASVSAKRQSALTARTKTASSNLADSFACCGGLPLQAVVASSSLIALRLNALTARRCISASWIAGFVVSALPLPTRPWAYSTCG